MAADFDVLIVGAGAVGLAVAAEAARRGLSTLVIEQHEEIGKETSSRNSEVVHAGLYYRPGSLKAQCCVRGREAFYRFASLRGVPFRRCGKMIVATCAEELSALESVANNAEASGVSSLEWLDAREINGIEPALRGEAALLSRETGIFDSHAFLFALLAEAESLGAQIVLRTRAERICRVSSGWSLKILGEDRPVLVARNVINSAGLGALAVASAIEGYSNPSRLKAHYAKGTYYSYASPVPFRHLIYPVPVPGGLGTHLTLDLAGRARFGPDVEWVGAPSYDVSPNKRQDFFRAIATYWPDVKIERLRPDYAGVRPKITGPDQGDADFVIEGYEKHRLEGVVNLFGIESPGLTSSLALAQLAVNALNAN